MASLQIFAMKTCLWIRQSNPVSRGHFFKEKESITLLLSYENPLAQNYPTCFENRFLMGYYKIFTQREMSLKSLLAFLKRVASTPWHFPPNKENQSLQLFVQSTWDQNPTCPSAKKCYYSHISMYLNVRKKIINFEGRVLGCNQPIADILRGEFILMNPVSPL